MSDGYLLQNSRPEAVDRFAAMAALFDPVTLAHLDRLRIGPGARCWEVGAGGPALPRALAARVGAAGSVLATDLDPCWLAEDEGYQVRRHDVVADPPPAGPFDLVHARLLLVHLPDREQVLARLTGALRPGGWLLVEDADPALQPLACPDQAGPAEQRANRLRRVFRELLAERGADLAFGRTLPRLLGAAGLVEVGAQVWFPLTDPACAVLEAATIGHLRPELVGSGRAGEAELDGHLAALAAGLQVTTAPLVSAWGRRPA